MKQVKEFKKINCIIDCDPGVDDVVALTLSLYDSVMDIKLVTTVNGNLDLHSVTRNVLHVLEKFKRTDIPVAMGADRPMGKSMPNATFIHQKYGMGGYIPPEKVETLYADKLRIPLPEEGIESISTQDNYHDNSFKFILAGNLVSFYNENAILNPINPYGRTKYFIEEIIKDYCKANPQFKAIILRFLGEGSKVYLAQDRFLYFSIKLKRQQTYSYIS